MRRLDIPHETDPDQCIEAIKGQDGLPPPESLASAALVGMVIVVPPLTHGEQRQQPIIARIVAGHIPLAATYMRKRIDAEGGVVEEDGAPEESHNKTCPTADGEAQRGKQNRRHEFVL